MWICFSGDDWTYRDIEVYDANTFAPNLKKRGYVLSVRYIAMHCKNTGEGIYTETEANKSWKIFTGGRLMKVWKHTAFEKCYISKWLV